MRNLFFFQPQIQLILWVLLFQQVGGAGGLFLAVGMNSVFTEEILAEKLSKLNSSQQCIESILHFFLHDFFLASEFNFLGLFFNASEICCGGIHAVGFLGIFPQQLFVLWTD